MKNKKVYKAYEIKRLQQLNGVILATFKQRAIAFILDCITAFFLLIIVFFIIGIIIWNRATDSTFTTYAFRFDIVSWYGRVIINIIVPVLYFGLFTYFTNGQTIGKKIMKIRVVSLINKKITLWGSIERALGYGVSVFELGIGFFQYFFHPNCRTAEDCLAETIVIKDEGISK